MYDFVHGLLSCFDRDLVVRELRVPFGHELIAVMLMFSRLRTVPMKVPGMFKPLDGSLSDKGSILASYQPDRRTWDVAQGDEYVIRVYGDTAVVIGKWAARGNNNGQRFDYAARFLSIYVRRNGRWQMVAEQSTEIR